MKKIILVSFLILFFVSALADEKKKNTFYIFGQYNSIAAAEREYAKGQTDFSRMESYSTKGFGFGYDYNVWKVFHMGFDVQYSMAGKVQLIDTSDNDEVTVDGYPQICGFAVAGLEFGSKNFLIFVNGGAGVSSISGSEKKYKSSLGYDVTLESPEKKTAFAGFGGTGLRVLIGSFGLFANARYTLDHFKKLSIVSGLCFMF